MYNDYYLRSVESLWPQMIQFGVALGVISVAEESTISATDGGAWDYIGPILQPTGEIETVNGIEVFVLAPLTAPNGEVYLHANLRTRVNLRAVAIKLAQENTELASAMQQLSQFFLLDENGNARLPTNPHRTWA